MEIPPPPPAVRETSISDVLTNEDLLSKILRCLGCQSCLVRAALTSKRWLRGASRLFVRDFCARHSPRLLGIYVSSSGISGSEFVPLLQPDTAGPAASSVLNHANFGFGNLPAPNVLDCQNGMVLFNFGGAETFNLAGIIAVRSPLLYPNRDMAMVLPLAIQPPPSEYPDVMLLPVDHGDDALCYHVNVRTWESDNTTHCLAFVFVLRSGSWSIDCVAMGPLAKSPIKILPTTVLAGGKIYMATEAGYILGLDPSKEEFFIVDLPEGVELDQYPGNLVHCRGDDSVLYLFHVDRENRLNVWLHRMIDGGHENGGAGAAGIGANGWVLRDTISVHETCGHLVEPGWETAAAGDEDEDAVAVSVVGAGDNAEFVFLELGITGVIVYMHIKTREVKQVYQKDEYDDVLVSIHPFMFVGHPIFPALDEA